MDSLEKFISENRNHLDIYEPSENLFQKITLRKPKKIFFLRQKSVLLKIAASIIIFVAGFSVNKILYSPKNQQLTDLPTEIKEAEVYYSMQLNSKWKELKVFATQYPDIELETQNEIAQLDSIYASLKNDLKDNIDNQEVIEAMIQNYQVKLKVLEDILFYLSKKNQKNDEKKTTIL